MLNVILVNVHDYAPLGKTIRTCHKDINLTLIVIADASVILEDT